MTHTIITKWKENLQFESDNPSGHTVMMDASEENGGLGAGLAPKAMMLSSLAGCTGLDVILILKKYRTEIKDLKITVNGELTETLPKYYRRVSVDYHFYGKNLEKEKIKKAVDLSVDTYCGVLEMFRRFAEVKVDIHYHED